MRAVVVEVDAPCRHQMTRMAQAVEQMLVEAFNSLASIVGWVLGRWPFVLGCPLVVLRERR